jgi:DNA-binding GntR family transcriptional regulator
MSTIPSVDEKSRGPRPKLTRTEQVAAQVRSDILTGHLQPGEALPLGPLRAEYGVSLSVVREALTRLTAQGLVTSKSHHGFSVTLFSDDDLQELWTALVEIETLATRRAIERADVRWEARIIAALHMLEATPHFVRPGSAEVTPEWIEAHTEFHSSIVEGCGSRLVSDFAKSLRESAEVIHRASAIPAGATRDVAGEHAAIQQAVVARNVDRAVELVAAHIDRTMRFAQRCLADSREQGAQATIRSAPDRGAEAAG